MSQNSCELKGGIMLNTLKAPFTHFARVSCGAIQLAMAQALLRLNLQQAPIHNNNNSVSNNDTYNNKNVKKHKELRKQLHKA